MASSTKKYHGLHEYSTYRASTIRSSHFFGNIPQETNVSHYLCCLCRLSSSFILHPVGPFRSCWDMFIMMLLIYATLETPFTLAFGQSSTVLYMNLFIDICLSFDIFFNFHTAYFDKWDQLRLVTNKKYICKRYLRAWFAIDLVTCIPFELINPSNSDDYAQNATKYIKALRILRLIRIVKMLRFFKMVRIFDAFMKQFIHREVKVFMKFFKMIFGMLIFAHFAACLWWFVGTNTSSSWIDAKGLRDNDVDRFTKYSYSFYWAVVTLFTTGYGDIVATNITEQWVCSICILIGTCFFAYFVGSLTVLITEGDKLRSYQSSKLEEAESFCAHKKLPKELTHAILTHIRYYCAFNYVFDTNKLLQLLPTYLQQDIHNCIAKQFLLELKIFQNDYIRLSDFIIGKIAIKAKSISCNQCYKLYDIGDIAKEFYIQRTGKSTMYNAKNQVIQRLNRGSVCGEYEAMLFKKRKAKIACDIWSEFYCINVDEIRQILDLYYPKSSLSKWKQIQKYIKSSYKKNVQHFVEFDRENEPLYDSSKPNTPKLTNSNSKTISPHYLRSRTTPKTLLLPESDYECYDDSDIVCKQSKSDTASPQPNNIVQSHRMLTFAKFNMRTNSKLRNVAVVKHGEKHNKSENRSIKKCSSEPKLKHIMSQSLIQNEDKQTKEVSSHEKVAYDDSECSFLSISTSFDDDAKNERLEAILCKERTSYDTKDTKSQNKTHDVYRKRHETPTTPTIATTGTKQKTSTRTIATVSSFESLPFMENMTNSSEEHDVYMNEDDEKDGDYTNIHNVSPDITTNYPSIEMPQTLFLQSIQSNVEIDHVETDINVDGINTPRLNMDTNSTNTV